MSLPRMTAGVGDRLSDGSMVSRTEEDGYRPDNMDGTEAMVMGACVMLAVNPIPIWASESRHRARGTVIPGKAQMIRTQRVDEKE